MHIHVSQSHGVYIVRMRSRTFKLYGSDLRKVTEKWLWYALPFRIHLIYSFWYDSNILCMKRGKLSILSQSQWHSPLKTQVIGPTVIQTHNFPLCSLMPCLCPHPKSQPQIDSQNNHPKVQTIQVHRNIKCVVPENIHTPLMEDFSVLQPLTPQEIPVYIVASYMYLFFKMLVYLPLGFSNDLPWEEYGYFLEPYNHYFSTPYSPIDLSHISALVHTNSRTRTR